jgi:hypothetical protein
VLKKEKKFSVFDSLQLSLKIVLDDCVHQLVWLTLARMVKQILTTFELTDLCQLL